MVVILSKVSSYRQLQFHRIITLSTSQITYDGFEGNIFYSQRITTISASKNPHPCGTISNAQCLTYNPNEAKEQWSQ